MNKKSILKRTLGISIASACAAVAIIPVVANSVINTQNTTIIAKNENNGSFIMGEDANYNPNFKVDLSVLRAEENDLGVWFYGEHKNDFSIDKSSSGHWYHDIVRWEKSYDGGKTFEAVTPNQGNGQFALFHRENRNFVIRRMVDWCYDSLEDVAFITNSSSLKVNKKITSSLTKVNETIEKANLKFNLDFLNDSSESMLFTLTKEINGQKTIIETVSDFKKISEISSIKEENGKFYYSIPNVNKELKSIKYTLNFTVASNDHTKRTSTLEFELDKLSSEIKINKIETSNENNQSVNVSVNFDKIGIINDYEIQFVEVDANGNKIENGYKPAIRKIDESNYELIKDSFDRLYKVEVSSKKLGSTSISNSSFNVSKKEVTNPEKPNPNPNPEDKNPTLPDVDNGIVDSDKNSSYTKSTIAIITTLSLISLIAIVCSIVLFVNRRKK